ncbi:hypothetical protein [Sulfuricella sp. T08]|uniref:hypothetical protein n=1 Tax=Sulfuricella sp. T08 TaxID=1632857 RepID=UPI0007508002|nr:hypothetical protein [Sulfuricella sp. T08]
MSDHSEVVDTKRRGTFLNGFLWLVVVTSAYLFLSNLLAISKDFDTLQSYPSQVQFFAYASTILWGLRIVGGIAAILWKKWGIYLLALTFLPGIAFGTLVYPSVQDAVPSFLGLVLIAFLVRSKWSHFA